MAGTSYLQEILSWVADNKEWVVSSPGVAVIVCVVVIGIVVICVWQYYKNKSSGQTAVAKNGIIYQAGRDFNIGDKNEFRK